MLEKTYEGCASVCRIPLFYLTKDISLGMPEAECISEAMTKANTKAQEISELIFNLGVVVLSTILFTFGVCSKEGLGGGSTEQVTTELQLKEGEDNENISF